ncbi:glycoside hydrolase family protein [Brevundimonas sp. VNH65]|uniref:lysozyme n=1 Tax=Brevundimonas sp. VNH65 TaxID=3400917 RepID=UPI003C01B857
MSDAASPRMKISREGVLLIKSFEGFRSRAVAGPDGGWIIGYGHRASAREGASVSEAEAELLLQYDLMPVQAALSQGLTREVNQHQYDALASFAFSVGPDTFRFSDVLTRFNAGDDAATAEALAGWPEPVRRDVGLRRRAAERALFLADPAQPVALADLLAAPLPIPVAPEPTTPEAPVLADAAPNDADAVEPAPVEGGIEAPSEAALATADADADADAKVDGSAADAESAVETAPPSDDVSQPAAADAPAVSTEDAEDGASMTESPEAAAVSPDPEPAAEADTPPPLADTPVEASVEAAAAVTDIVEPAPVTPVFSPRYMAYSGTNFGPLPTANDDTPQGDADLTPEAATTQVAEIEPAVIEAVENALPVAEAAEAATEVEPAPEPVSVEAELLPQVEAEAPTPAAEAPEVETPAVDAPMLEAPVVDAPAVDAPEVETPAGDMEPLAPPVTPTWAAPSVQAPLVLPEAPGADPFANAPQSSTLGSTLTSPPPAPAPLVWPALNEDLGGPTDSAGLATPRLVWPRDEAAPVAAAPGLFEQDSGELNLSGAGPAWGEPFDPKPNVFAWRKVWAYLVMGGFGLVSLAISMAALRRASLANTDVGGILAIAGVLALIGAACVGVSAYNIYQRITDDR